MGTNLQIIITSSVWTWIGEHKMRIKRGFILGIVVGIVVLAVLIFGEKEEKEYVDTENQHKTLNENAEKEDWIYNDSNAELEEGTDIWMSHAYRIIDTWKNGTLKDVQTLLPVDKELTEEDLYAYMHDTWPTKPFTIRMRGNFLEEDYNVMFFDVYIQEADGYYKQAVDSIVMTIYEDGTFVPFADEYDSEWKEYTEEDIINKAWEIVNEKRAQEDVKEFNED